MAMNMNEMRDEAHSNSKNKGWWDTDLPFNIPEKLALIHSEVSEALEEYRLHGNSEKLCHFLYEAGGGLHDTMESPEGKLRKPVGFGSEIADIIIRCGDLAGKLGLNLDRLVEEKMAYNRTRSHRHGNKVA